MASMLDLPPPLELAIGQLSPNEQSHAQVSMRVLAAHLSAPCVVVNKSVGDITLKPCPGDDQNICVASMFEEARIERPIRLVPLSEALSKLIDGIISRSLPGRAASPELAADPTSNTPAALIDLLLTRSLAGPVEVQLASGRSVLVDARYSTAHLSCPIPDALVSLNDDAVISAWPIASEAFASRTAKGNSLHPIGVEQLCWALSPTAESAPALDRWHRDTQVRLSLRSWPNLSAQSDANAWLPLLAGLFRADMRLDDVLQHATAAGIPAARARHGIALLLTYRHAQITTAADTSTANVVQLVPASQRAPRPSAGLLGRLRSRLRALAA